MDPIVVRIFIMTLIACSLIFFIFYLKSKAPNRESSMKEEYSNIPVDQYIERQEKLKAHYDAQFQIFENTVTEFKEKEEPLTLEDAVILEVMQDTMEYARKGGFSSTEAYDINIDSDYMKKHVEARMEIEQSRRERKAQEDKFKEVYALSSTLIKIANEDGR